MRLLMVSGDRQVAVGERGPFHSMQREFSRYFERIDVLCPRPDRPVSVRTIHERVHFHPADCGRLAMPGWIARRGAELLAEHGHALIVSHDYGWFYNGLGSARLSAATGVPYLSEIHHVPGYPVAADLRERLDRAVARRYVRWARRRARAFRVVNHREMPELLERWGVPRAQIVVLPSLYIDLQTFRPAPQRPEPEQDVLFVGRLVNNKGLERIVEALAGLAASGRPQRALFVGKGPLAQRLRRQVSARGLASSVRFVEWLASPEDLAEVYRRSRVIVCASTCEGGPRVTVEAMACGTPAVTTRVGMMGELIEPGVNGELVGFDVASLRAGLERALGDEARRAELGRRAAQAAAQFEYSSILRGYALGLHALVGDSGVRLLFLTQVLDRGDAVLGFVPRWLEGLAAHCERIRVVALEVGDTAGLPSNVDWRVIGRRGTLRRWLRYRAVLNEALADGGFDTILAHMVPRYALLAARPARRHGARLFLWYTHAGVDRRLLAAERAVESIFTVNAASLRVETAKRVETGHGIDLAHFDVPDAPPGPPRLLAVGRMTPAKDPLTLVAAVAELERRGIHVELDLVGGGLASGDGAYGVAVRERIQSAGLARRVHLHGDVPYRDIARCYGECTLLVSASRTGSVDKVVLEAMAARRPVVTCNESFAPIFAELAADCAALQFPLGDAAALADRVAALLARSAAERRALGERLRGLVARDHEVDALMARLCAHMRGRR